MSERIDVKMFDGIPFEFDLFELLTFLKQVLRNGFDCVSRKISENDVYLQNRIYLKQFLMLFF